MAGSLGRDGHAVSRLSSSPASVNSYVQRTGKTAVSGAILLLVRIKLNKCLPELDVDLYYKFTIRYCTMRYGERVSYLWLVTAVLTAFRVNSRRFEIRV